jgi:hypothetical protein
VVSPRLLRHLLDHLGIVLAIGASMLVALRISIIANLNPVTALAILQNLGVANVLVGTLLSVYPLIVGLAFVVAAIYAIRRKSAVAGWVAYGLAVLSFFVVPWNMFVPLSILAVFKALRERSRRPRKSGGDALPGRTRQRLHRWGDALAVWFVVTWSVISLFAIQPWLAPEVVETVEGDTYVAYVLRDGSDGAALLRQRARHVIYLEDGLERREICQGLTSGFDERSLYETLVNLERYPKCPPLEEER